MAASCAPTLSRPLEISTPSDMCGMIQRITLLKMAVDVWGGGDSVEYGRCCMRFRAHTVFKIKQSTWRFVTDCFWHCLSR
jgi:hypothetical protein